MLAWSRTSHIIPTCTPSRSVEAGINLAAEVVESGVDLIATGDMVIGNTTASSAITSAVTGISPDQTTGEGTGRTLEQDWCRPHRAASELALPQRRLGPAG